MNSIDLSHFNSCSDLPPPPRVTCCKADTFSSSITANWVIEQSRLFNLQEIGRTFELPNLRKRDDRSLNGSRLSVTGELPIIPYLLDNDSVNVTTRDYLYNLLFGLVG